MIWKIIFLTFLYVQVQSCPTGGESFWVELGEFCYSVSREPVDWGTAQEYCWSEGGYLAEILDVQEEILLDTFLIEGISYWLGLSDLAHPGTWRWQESHQVPGYTNWAPGEPNSDLHHCVWKTYVPNHSGWLDNDCSWTSHEVYGQAHALCQADK